MATHIDHYRVTIGSFRNPETREKADDLRSAVETLKDHFHDAVTLARIDAVNEDGSYREVLVLDTKGVYA